MARLKSTITLIGAAQTGNASNGGNVTLTFNVAPQPGDVVIVVGGHGPAGGNTIGPSTAGYTALHTDTTNTNCRGGVWRKVMGTTPDTTVVCQGAGNAADGVAYVSFVFRGVDNGTPEDATTTVTTNNATGFVPDSPSITTVTDGAVVLSLALTGINDATPGTVSGYSTPVSGNNNDTNPVTTAGCFITKATAGAENPAAYSTWTSSLGFAATVALRPLQSDAGDVVIPERIARHNLSSYRGDFVAQPSLVLGVVATPSPFFETNWPVPPRRPERIRDNIDM